MHRMLCGHVLAYTSSVPLSAQCPPLAHGGAVRLAPAAGRSLRAIDPVCTGLGQHTVGRSADLLAIPYLDVGRHRGAPTRTTSGLGHPGCEGDKRTPGRSA